MAGSTLTWCWRPALAVSSLLVLLGGALHPPTLTDASFEHATAVMLADAFWGPSHALILAGLLLLTPGLIGLAARIGSSSVRATVRFAVAGALLSSVEMAFHLAASADLEALLDGRPTPIFHAHQVLSTLAQPLLGFAVATLALLTARHAIMIDRVVSLAGMFGGLVFGLAAPIIVGTRDPHFEVLFWGSVPMSLWLFWIGATGGRSLRNPSALEPVPTIVA